LTSAIGDIREWFFMDSDHAWILYSNGILYRTENRGRNWYDDEVPFDMGKLFFLNSNGTYQGWVLKEDGTASGNVPVDVYRLINNEWTLIHKGGCPILLWHLAICFLMREIKRVSFFCRMQRPVLLR